MADTKTDRLAAEIAASIDAGAYARSMRMKSLRAAAQAHGVHIAMLTR